ncbi:hypothetical protein C0993_001380 [Termitomyces sp. T159_Od127]|nr:hypothetical protein C0993_001380 [Termitomyces sp. T159_Od127]
MNWLTFFDESTDIATPEQAQKLAAISMDAMRNPGKARPVGECVIGEAARQFWDLSSQCATLSARRRFIQEMDKFTASVVQQAQDRAQNYIRNIDDYLLLRRDTIGAKPSFVLLEFKLNLPDEVFEDLVIQRLVNICVDMIILSNDMYSFNVEQARRDDHNIVTTLMHHENLDLEEAMKWIRDYASKLVQNFMDALNYVPYFGEEIQGDVKRYLDGLGNWVRANDSWSLECRRYFATGGMEIQQSRKAVLLPWLVSYLQ